MNNNDQESKFVRPRPYPLPLLPPNMYYEDLPLPSEEGDGAVMFIEDTDDFDLYSYRLKRTIFDGRTAFQKVLIAETMNYGLVLALDGALQSAEDDEAIYHEMLVHPAMLAHPEPKDVLIVGGG